MFNFFKEIILLSDINFSVYFSLPLSYVYLDQLVYLYRSVDMHNLSDTKTIVSINLTTPDGLAVDWIADNIYWTDAGRKVLEVARLDGSSRKIVVQDGLDEPRALAMFPHKGYIKYNIFLLINRIFIKSLFIKYF